MAKFLLFTIDSSGPRWKPITGSGSYPVSRRITDLTEDKIGQIYNTTANGGNGGWEINPDTPTNLNSISFKDNFTNMNSIHVNFKNALENYTPLKPQGKKILALGNSKLKYGGKDLKLAHFTVTTPAGMAGASIWGLKTSDGFEVWGLAEHAGGDSNDDYTAISKCSGITSNRWRIYN